MLPFALKALLKVKMKSYLTVLCHHCPKPHRCRPPSTRATQQPTDKPPSRCPGDAAYGRDLFPQDSESRRHGLCLLAQLRDTVH